MRSSEPSQKIDVDRPAAIRRTSKKEKRPAETTIKLPTSQIDVCKGDKPAMRL